MRQFNGRFILILTLLLVSLSPFLLEAGSQGSLTIQKTWGTSLNDLGKAVATDSQGNIYVTGLYNATDDYTGVKLLLLKYDAGGNLLWARSWQDNASGDTYSVAVDGNGNVVVGGETCGTCSPLLLKLDSSGNLIWANTWVSPPPLFAIRAIASDSSGNVYVTGTRTIPGFIDTEIFVMKLDPAGNIVWQIHWDNGLHDSESRSIFVRGGGIYVGGTSFQVRASPFLLKFNSTGGLVWQKTWQANSSRTRAAAIDSSGNVYVTGETYFGGMGSCSGHPCNQVFVLKFNPNGSLACQRTWGDTRSDNLGKGIATNSRGHVFVSGYTSGPGSKMNDTILLEMSSSCNLLWSGTWGGLNDDYGYGIATDSTGAAIMTGSVGESPPYTFNTANSSLGIPNFPSSNANGTISRESVSVTTLSGSLFIPNGSETCAGSADLFILKYNDNFPSPSFPAFTPLLIAIVTACISCYRRFIVRSTPNKTKTRP